MLHTVGHGQSLHPAPTPGNLDYLDSRLYYLRPQVHLRSRRCLLVWMIEFLFMISEFEILGVWGWRWWSSLLVLPLHICEKAPQRFVLTNC